MNQNTIITLALSLMTSMLSAQVLNESNKLTAPDGAAEDEYGQAVAISGARALIGAPFDDDFGDDSGSVYVRSGQQSFKLNASDASAGDRFGWSVAVSGSYAIVGAPYDTDDGFGTGAAYVFDLSTGQELYKLLAQVPDGGDYFGISVAMDGNVAIIGADGADDFGTASGAAYVFDLTTGLQIHKLTATLGATQDHFGASVDIEGNLAVIGAYGDGLATSNYGAAYIFDVVTGQELHKLVASDADDEDEFGYAVAMSGNSAVIGAWKNDDQGTETGSAYIFNVNTGTELHKLTASNASGSDYFARSVAADGELAIIGAPLVGAGGAAYVYDLSTGAEISMLVPSDTTAGDWFSHSVAIDGTNSLVGARFDNDLGNHSGSAYLFNVELCEADINDDGQLNFFDVSAFLSAFASQDSAADFTNDGAFNFFDVSAFLSAFSAGCP